MITAFTSKTYYDEMEDVPRGAEIRYRKDPDNSQDCCQGIFLEPFGSLAKILTEDHKVTTIPEESLV